MKDLLSNEHSIYAGIAILAIYALAGIVILNKIYGKDIDKQSSDRYSSFLVKKELYAGAVLIWPILWLNHCLHFKNKKDEKKG